MHTFAFGPSGQLYVFMLYACLGLSLLQHLVEALELSLDVYCLAGVTGS